MGKVLGVIPARLGSTRIPKKMLADVGGKTLIERTIERTKKAKLIDALVVSTDSDEIEKVATSAGVAVIRTSPEIKTGTDRVAATLELFKEFEPELVVNIWGDEPLFPADAIDNTAKLLLEDSNLQVACAADLIEDEEMLMEPSIVKVLTDLENYALTFSRSPIPHPYNKSVPFEHYHVIGVMAMRAAFLQQLRMLPQTPIELREGVEQMRILEHGIRMRILKGNWKNLGANMPEELEEIRKRYAAMV